MTVATIQYGPAANEVRRDTHELGELVEIHRDAVAMRTFKLDVTLPPPPSGADAQASAGAR